VPAWHVTGRPLPLTLPLPLPYILTGLIMGSNLSQAMWPCYSSYISKRRCIKTDVPFYLHLKLFQYRWVTKSMMDKHCKLFYDLYNKNVQHWLTDSCCCKQSYWTIWNLATSKERLNDITSKCKCHDCIGRWPERIKSNLEVTVTSLKQTLNNQTPLPTNAHNRISNCT